MHNRGQSITSARLSGVEFRDVRSWHFKSWKTSTMFWRTVKINQTWSLHEKGQDSSVQFSSVRSTHFLTKKFFIKEKSSNVYACNESLENTISTKFYYLKKKKLKTESCIVTGFKKKNRKWPQLLWLSRLTYHFLNCNFTVTKLLDWHFATGARQCW